MDGAGGVITGTGASGTAKAIGATGAGTTKSLSQFEACVPFPPGPVAQPASATTSRQNIQTPRFVPWGKGRPDRLSRLLRVKNAGRSPPSPAGPGTQTEVFPGSSTGSLCEWAGITQAVSGTAPEPRLLNPPSVAIVCPFTTQPFVALYNRSEE